MEQRAEVREMMFAIDQARRRLLQPRFTQLGLTLGQGQPRILNYLLKREDITQKELADACHLEVTTDVYKRQDVHNPDITVTVEIRDFGAYVLSLIHILRE